MLAVFTKLGVTGTLGQRVVTCLIGVTVVPLAALSRARLMGTTAGVIAALLAALNPAFWMNDVNVLSEALLAPLIAAIVLVAIGSVPRSAGVAGGAPRCAHRPRRAHARKPGSCSPSSRSRRGTAHANRKEALWSIAAATIAMVAVLAPWTIYNQTRFERPVLLSNNFGGTLSSANCDIAWHGAKLGWWQFGCEGNIKESGEESVRDRFLRGCAATDYVRDNLARLPVVILGAHRAELDVFRPDAAVALDANRRPRATGRRHAIGLLMYALIVLFCIPGVSGSGERAPRSPGSSRRSPSGPSPPPRSTVGRGFRSAAMWCSPSPPVSARRPCSSGAGAAATAR